MSVLRWQTYRFGDDIQWPVLHDRAEQLDAKPTLTIPVLSVCVDGVGEGGVGLSSRREGGADKGVAWRGRTDVNVGQVAVNMDGDADKTLHWLLTSSEFRVNVKHWSSSRARIGLVHFARVAHMYLATTFPQVIYKKFLIPEIVSFVQSARWSGFPHDSQPPSSSFAYKSSSTTCLLVTGNSHFKKERTDVLALSTLLLSVFFRPCHKFLPLFPNHSFPKRPFFSHASFSARKTTIIFCCQLRIICAVQDAQCNTEE